MVRKKNSKALFEVLSRGPRGVEVPDWVKKKPEDQEQTPDAEPLKEDLPQPESETQEAKVEPVKAQEPTTEDVEITEPEVQPEEKDEAAAKTAQTELLTTEEDATDDVSDTSNEANEKTEVAEDVEDAEVIEDTEVTEIDDSKADIDEDVTEPPALPSEESDEAVTEDALEPDSDVEMISRVKRELPYEIPRDDVADFATQPSEPILQVGEERIRISMTRVGAMVTLGAVLVLLVAAFALGLGVGKSRSPEDSKLPPKATNLNIAGTKVGGQGATKQADNDKAVLVEPNERTVGRFYFIFEELDGVGDEDRVHATSMLTLFRERGFPSQLMKINKKGDKERFVLWGLHGFENPKSKAAKKYEDGIKRIGEEYFREYGKYACKNPDPRKKREPPK